jgi:hypothetical protein
MTVNAGQYTIDDSVDIIIKRSRVLTQAIVPQSKVRESGYYIYRRLILFRRRNVHYIDKLLL